MNDEIYEVYPHNPPHLFCPNAIYMITGGVMRKEYLLDSNKKKAHFFRTLAEWAELLGWELEAWSVLPNHYHFVARAPEEAVSLKSLIQAAHSISSKYLNRLDNTPGRRVWYNYWDTCITNQTSYIARLHYVHTNAVKHGLVDRPEDYPHCSYRWFVRRAELDFRRIVFAQPIDKLRVKDDY
ncbi:MAG: transposase [Anaerolineales bacterium]|nr:transposase [Anaerolineales bacterium]